MCLKYLKAEGTIILPSKTYLSVPSLVIHAGCRIKFEDTEWSGVYELSPYPIVDCATRFSKNMYIKGTYQCLSFHIRKVLPIAKGGMILTDDKEAVDLFKKARYEGRDNREPHDSIEDLKILGWNFYMPPEQAARGILLFNELKEDNKDTGGSWKYKDLSHYTAWKGYITND